MLSTVAFVIGGAIVAALLWLGLRATFAAPTFGRTNYRGVSVPVAAGVVIVLTSLLAAAGDSVLHMATHGQGRYSLGVGAVLVTVLGFGLLGLFDDLGASGNDRGFKGHVTAMAHGRLTTGGVKLLFGGLVALAVAAAADGSAVGRVLVDGAVIALAANVGNLFDRAPGRTSKVAVACGVVLLAFEHTTSMAGVAVVVGAAIGLLVFDLREDLMLGDAGANVLGAVLGLGVVISCPLAVRIVVLVVVLALNGASERVSFSRVIARVGPLRALDGLGRRFPPDNPDKPADPAPPAGPGAVDPGTIDPGSGPPR